MSNVLCLDMATRRRDRAAERAIESAQPDLIAQLRAEFSNYAESARGYVCAMAVQMQKRGVSTDEIVRRARACIRNIGAPAPGSTA